MDGKITSPAYLASPWRSKYITDKAARHLDAIIGEIVQAAEFGIVILYIEHGRIARATPGIIGRSEKFHDADT